MSFDHEISNLRIAGSKVDQIEKSEDHGKQQSWDLGIMIFSDQKKIDHEKLFAQLMSSYWF